MKKRFGSFEGFVAAAFIAVVVPALMFLKLACTEEKVDRRTDKAFWLWDFLTHR